jgi:ribosomal protein S18 acetylase RimI-like enzyme
MHNLQNIPLSPNQNQGNTIRIVSCASLLKTDSALNAASLHRFCAAFVALNKEWIERYFSLEKTDYEIFANPTKIVTDGGDIFFALLGEEIVGTVALLNEDSGKRFEISKLAVSSEHRRMGIGEKLLSHVLAYANERGIFHLHLISNTKLTPAIRLYEKFGFVPVPQLENQSATSYTRGHYFAELHLPKHP